jgi:hypothetical protein
MSSPTAPVNSTNVRNDIRRVREDSARVLAVALATWGIVIAAAAVEGAFARFAAETLVAFAAGISLYGVCLYFLDRSLRGFAATMRARSVIVANALSLAALAAALAMGWVALAAFFAPLAAVSGVAAAERWRQSRRAPRSAPAKSPGANPAAT